MSRSTYSLTMTIRSAITALFESDHDEYDDVLIRIFFGNSHFYCSLPLEIRHKKKVIRRLLLFSLSNT